MYTSKSMSFFVVRVKEDVFFSLKELIVYIDIARSIFYYGGVFG
jgi:hypothetical protein